MLRRNLMVGLLGTTALAGCSNTNAISTAVQYAQAAAAGALALLPDLSAVNVPASVISAVQTAANTLSAAASALQSSTASSQGTIYQTIAAAVSAIVAAVTPVAGLPGIVVTVLQALQAIVPAIASALGILGVSAPRVSMSGDRAAAILKAYGATSGK